MSIINMLRNISIIKSTHQHLKTAKNAVSSEDSLLAAQNGDLAVVEAYIADFHHDKTAMNQHNCDAGTDKVDQVLQRSRQLFPWNQGIDHDCLMKALTRPEYEDWNDFYCNAATALGYSGLKRGLCAGFASTGATAFWVSILGFHEDGIKAYLNRIHLLKTEKVQTLDRDLSVHGFFSRIKLIQESQSILDYHDSLLGIQSRTSTEKERINRVEAIIKPLVLEDLIPENPWRICMEDTFIGVYSFKELETYLQKMIEYLGSLPFELSLSSGHHQISLCFCPTQNEWLLFNASNYPLTVFKATNSKELAGKLEAQLSGYDQTIIQTSIKCIAPLKNHMQERIDRLKKDEGWISIHAFNPTKIHSVNRGRISALYIAAQEGNVDVVKGLLDRGAKVNQANNNGATPLFIAAQNGHVAIVKELLSRGAKVNQANNKGAAPLFVASHQGHLPVVKELLAQEAKVIQADDDGWTALLNAVQNGHVDVVKELLANGAQAHHADNDGVTAVNVAEYHHGKDHPIYKLLFQQQYSLSSTYTIL